jgi:chromate transporter
MKAPSTPLHLAWVCTRLAVQGFGGVLAVAQHEFVEREGWLTDAEFLALLASAQLLPGPNIVNLSIMLGERHFGWCGVLAALLGLLLVPLCLVIGLYCAVQTQLQAPQMQAALRGMGLAASGLLFGMAFKLAKLLGAAALLMAAALRLPVAQVILWVGGAGTLLAARKL